MKRKLLIKSCFFLILGVSGLKAQSPCQLVTSLTPNTPVCAGTPVLLSVSAGGANLGSGVDGVLTINTTVYTDNVKSAVVGSNLSGSNKVRVANTAGYAVGNEVLLITMQDANTVGNLVGRYEYRTISSISLDTLRFTQNISNSYIATATLKHQVVKVPQYTNVTINSGGVLTCAAWNGTVGGVLALKATGLITVNAGGSINANGKGYRGVTQKTALWRNADGGQGEGIYGTGIASGANYGSIANNSGPWLSPNGNGGGGGTGTGDSGGGGGGGYASAGSAGVNWGHAPGLGGLAVGNSSVTLLIMGGAGGEGGADEDGAYPGAGGNGGGIVSVTTNSIIVTGNVSSNGNIGGGASNGSPGAGCGTTAGGGGAGGSINLVMNSFSGSGSNITVSGGTGGLSTGGCNSGGATGGAGSNGRIRLDMTGTLPVTNPPAYQGTTTVATGVTYLWSNSATTYSTFVTPNTTTNYTVTVNATSGCTSASSVVVVNVNPLPVVTVNSGAICAGNSFTMSPSGATTYTFSSGTAIVTPGANSSYNVSGTDLNGCVSTPAVCNVTVNALPLISVNSGAICAGDSFTMTPSGANTYTFSSGIDVVSPSSNTSYNVTGTDANGCVSSIAAVCDVTVNALPVITVNSGAICAGDSFTMIPSGATTYTFSNGIDVVGPLTSTSYSISGTDANGCVSSVSAVCDLTVNALPLITVNSGAICAGDSFTMIPSGANTYTFSNGVDVVTPSSSISYTVSGTDAFGCVNTAVSTVTVNSLPVITVNSGAICIGDSFTMTPTGASTYTFSNGIDVVTPVSNTSYSVTGTDANGCVTSVAAVCDVTVNALPLITVNSGVICSGDSFTMSPSGATTYTFSNGTNVVSPLTNTSYSVSGTDANGCVSSVSAVCDVTVNALPVLNASSSNSVICSGQQATLTVNGAITYTWSTASNNTSIVVSPVATTGYTVSGTDANGCSNSTSISQNVSICTGITNSNFINSELISVYPNPSNGLFNLELNTSSRIIVINALGGVIINQNMNSGTNNLDLQQFASGIYVIKVVQGNTQQAIKVIKQ